MMKTDKLYRFILINIAVAIFSIGALAQTKFLNPQGFELLPGTDKASYTPGPDPRTPEGKEFYDIMADHPNSKLVSYAMMDENKFREYFGISIMRNSKPNSIRVLMLGQDSTHFGEFTRYPGTSGFGGQVQNMANQLGQHDHVGTTNTVVSTIKGQAGAYNHPYFVKNDEGKIEVKLSGVMSNNLWTMFYDSDSPMAEWRNRFLDWVIRYNKDSLELISTFGGAARDAMASFINYKGGKVLPRISEKQAMNMLVPETKLVYAGGNNEFPVPVDERGHDLYAKFFEKKKLNYRKKEVQTDALDALNKNPEWFFERMVFTGGGFEGSGVLNPAQVGGYDLRKTYIDGKRTNNLKGLPLSDGTKMRNIIVQTSPHPSFLAYELRGKGIKAAEQHLIRSFSGLDRYFESGELVLDPEPGQKNIYRDTGRVRWSKAELPPGHFSFGTPLLRKGNSAMASRSGPSIINGGTRDRPTISKEIIDRAKYHKPHSYPPAGENFLEAASTIDRYKFDPGPGVKLATLMTHTINEKKLFEVKAGKSFEKHGIAAYYTGTHPDVGTYSAYRGDLTKPKAVILADPHGYDDLYTDRALTGARGQYLQGMMSDLGYSDRYAVFKTVPVGMQNASPQDWQHTLEATNKYREEMYKYLISKKPEVIFTDGKYAKAELARIAKNLNITVVNIERGSRPNDGIAKAMAEHIGDTQYKAHGENIPRSHLPYGIKNWVGTSGDRVFASQGIGKKGKLFVLVLPMWAYKQKMDLKKSEAEAIERTRMFQLQQGVVLAGTTIRDWVRNNRGKIKQCRLSFTSQAKF